MNYITIQDGARTNWPAIKLKSNGSNSKPSLPFLLPKRSLKFSKTPLTILSSTTCHSSKNSFNYSKEGSPKKMIRKQSIKMKPLNDANIITQKLQLYRSLNNRKKFFQDYLRHSLTPDLEVHQSLKQLNTEETELELFDVIFTKKKKSKQSVRLQSLKNPMFSTNQSKVTSPSLQQRFSKNFTEAQLSYLTFGEESLYSFAGESLSNQKSLSTLHQAPTPSSSQAQAHVVNNYHKYIPLKERVPYDDDKYTITSYRSIQYATQNLNDYKKQRSDMKKYNEKMLEKTMELERIIDELKERMVRKQNKQDRLNQRLKVKLNLNKILDGDNNQDKQSKKIVRHDEIWRKPRLSYQQKY